MNTNPPSSFAQEGDLSVQRPLGGLSHVRGAPVPELVNETIGGLLDRTVYAYGDHSTFVFVRFAQIGIASPRGFCNQWH